LINSEIKYTATQRRFKGCLWP